MFTDLTFLWKILSEKKNTHTNRGVNKDDEKHAHKEKIEDDDNSIK